MQTFVPLPDFYRSAAVLDQRRLGKQRIETLQILRALAGVSPGWRNHPATRMWRGCEAALGAYGLVVCAEWRRRGFDDSCAGQIVEALRAHSRRAARQAIAVADRIGPRGRSTVRACRMHGVSLPEWWGGPIHASHRASLLHRLGEWYGRFGWEEKPDPSPVYWPVPLLRPRRRSAGGAPGA